MLEHALWDPCLSCSLTEMDKGAGGTSFSAVVLTSAGGRYRHTAAVLSLDD